MGCPRCGSQNIGQGKHGTGMGWALMMTGIIGGILFCWPSVLIIFAFFLTEWRGHCGDCGWTWKT